MRGQKIGRERRRKQREADLTGERQKRERAAERKGCYSQLDERDAPEASEQEDDVHVDVKQKIQSCLVLDRSVRG